MRIAFLDLPFHRKTGSSQFFRTFLERMGQVDIHYVEFNEPHILRELVEAEYDLYILWQLEPFVPFFVYHRCRVVIVPMYDGCHGLGTPYWKAMRGARVINFSSALAREQVDAQLTTLSLQYFPDPSLFHIQSDFSTGRALFWQRRPEQGLNARFADRLIGQCVDTLHVHNAPDTVSPDDWPVAPHQTESRWQDDHHFFSKLMDRYNIFIAPRLAEGIGIALIDAMARGMLVIAANAPTASEYISHGANGILFPLDLIHTPKQLAFSLEEARRMGERARISIETGYRRMRAQDDAVMSFLATVPRPKRPYLMSAREERLFLSAALQFYQHTRRFKRNIRKTINYRLDRIGLRRMFAPGDVAI